MKNAPNLNLALLARQWGATAVPFGELSTQAWLETPQNQRALSLLDQTATLRSVLLLAGPNGVGKSTLVGHWLVSQYVQQSLAAVGITRQAIEPAALNLLTSASSGLARSLCLLGRAAWIEAASAGAQTIEPAHVQAAIERVPGAAGLVAPATAQTTA